MVEYADEDFGTISIGHVVCYGVVGLHETKSRNHVNDIYVPVLLFHKDML